MKYLILLVVLFGLTDAIGPSTPKKQWNELLKIVSHNVQFRGLDTKGCLVDKRIRTATHIYQGTLDGEVFQEETYFPENDQSRWQLQSGADALKDSAKAHAKRRYTTKDTVPVWKNPLYWQHIEFFVYYK